MKKINQIITVIGGTGFLGKHVVRELAKTGAIIRIVSRFGESDTQELRTCGSVGQLHFIKADIRDINAMNEAIKGSSIVINLVGILFEKSNRTFTDIHIEAAKNIAAACTKHGVKKLVHISALGVNNPDLNSKYALSKLEGEQAVLKEYPKAIIIRPSVIFGDEDNFINFFARMTKFSPFLPLIGGGETKIQPIYVGDVALAITKIISEKSFSAKILEIGGHEQYTYKQVMELILDVLGIRRCLLPIPFFIAKIKAFFFEFMPTPILTRDQIELLKFDNVIEKENALDTLGIKPKPMKSTIKKYLR